MNYVLTQLHHIREVVGQPAPMSTSILLKQNTKINHQHRYTVDSAYSLHLQCMCQRLSVHR